MREYCRIKHNSRKLGSFGWSKLEPNWKTARKVSFSSLFVTNSFEFSNYLAVLLIRFELWSSKKSLVCMNFARFCGIIRLNSVSNTWRRSSQDLWGKRRVLIRSALATLQPQLQSFSTVSMILLDDVGNAILSAPKTNDPNWYRDKVLNRNSAYKSCSCAEH